MKPLINHIIPRTDTKRAAALQLRAVQILYKRLLEMGGENVDHQNTTEKPYRVKSFEIKFLTIFGEVEFTCRASITGSNTFAIFGRFVTDDDQLRANAAKHLPSNPYSGKWNHFAGLCYTQMENLIGSVTSGVQGILMDKKARALSEPAY